MTLWEALVLGVVQGATEFLPVSSSGHLVIGQALLDLSIPGVYFEVAVHLATLLSVLVAYRRRLGRLVLGAARAETDAWRYVGLLVLATIPAGLVGILFRERVELLFDAEWVAGVALLVTGGLLWSTRAARDRGEDTPLRPPTTLDALVMGCAQAFALIPGISRSGSTVVAGLWLGVDAREAAAFSFLMSIPAIGGAALLSLPDILGESTGLTAWALLGGAGAAAVTGVLAIRTFIIMLEKHSFHHFAHYCWLVGTGFLVFIFLT